jgi:hypothetical protein
MEGQMKSKPQSEAQIARLVGQFPDLKDILQNWARDQRIKPNVTIKVKRADENFISFHGEMIDGESRSLSSGPAGSRGTKLEMIYIVSPSQSWPIRYIWNHQNRSRIQDVIKDTGKEVDYIILVTVLNYYQDIKDWLKRRLESPLGSLMAKEFSATVYLKPKKETFTELVARVDPAINVRLSMHDLMTSMVRDEEPYKQILAEFDQLGDSFEAQVYQAGLKTIVNSCSGGGLEGRFGDIKLLICAVAGRVMITFRRNGDSVTLICAETGPPCTGLQSVDATLPVAKKLIEGVIEAWKNSKTPVMERMKENPNIFII